MEKEGANKRRKAPAHGEGTRAPHRQRQRFALQKCFFFPPPSVAIRCKQARLGDHVDITMGSPSAGSGTMSSGDEPGCSGHLHTPPRVSSDPAKVRAFESGEKNVIDW